MQSFFMTKICFRALPMPQFTTLQKRVFPVYFSLQLGLVLLTAVTYPPRSLLSLVQHGHWTEHVPLTLNITMAVLNAFVYGPRTQTVMIERAHQGTLFQLACPVSSALSLDLKACNTNCCSLCITETKDARKCVDQDRDGGQESISEEMRQLKRNFSRNHAMAIHLNAIAMVATVWYGFSLASRINVTA
jgi:Domain of unknown function (DUF4149)